MTVSIIFLKQFHPFLGTIHPFTNIFLLIRKVHGKLYEASREQISIFSNSNWFPALLKKCHPNKNRSISCMSDRQRLGVDGTVRHLIEAKLHRHCNFWQVEHLLWHSLREANEKEHLFSAACITVYVFLKFFERHFSKDKNRVVWYKNKRDFQEVEINTWFTHKLKKYKSYNNSVFSSSNVRFYFHILHLLHDAIPMQYNMIPPKSNIDQ